MLENSIDDFRTKLCGCMKMDFKKIGRTWDAIVVVRFFY